jgi:hypothetical protein
MEKRRMVEMNNILPAITLYQPWATWIMREWKLIETRTHNKFQSLKGDTILIHAGQTTDASDYAVKNPYLTREQILQDPDEIINGHILGTAFVYDFSKLNDSHSRHALIDCGSVHRYGLFLENVKRFDTPIPVVGSIGIWYFDLVNREKVSRKEYYGQQELF